MPPSVRPNDSTQSLRRATHRVFGSRARDHDAVPDLHGLRALRPTSRRRYRIERRTWFAEPLGPSRADRHPRSGGAPPAELPQVSSNSGNCPGPRLRKVARAEPSSRFGMRTDLREMSCDFEPSFPRRYFARWRPHRRSRTVIRAEPAAPAVVGKPYFCCTRNGVAGTKGDPCLVESRERASSCRRATDEVPVCGPRKPRQIERGLLLPLLCASTAGRRGSRLLCRTVDLEPCGQPS